MRYNSWDVLIFPETGESKTPLQEFGTVCNVTQDPDVPAAPSTAHTAYLNTLTRPLPTMSCYIPSLPLGTPFRVSLHSWSTPQPSRATLSMTSTENMIMYEARVLLDGVCTAGIWFNQDPSWPQVIDMTSQMDKSNNHRQLRFPPFHAEMLTQVWADAAQTLGRVKVIIAEGIRNGQGNAGFQRLKNIVTFSFQHAPLHILENCGIAWPNAGMWLQTQQQFYNVSSAYPNQGDAEAHGHSPRRRGASIARATLETKMPPSGVTYGTTGKAVLHDRELHSNDSFWSQHGAVSDPFIGGVSVNDFYKNMASRNTTGSAGDVTMRSHTTSNSHDVSMPDASRPLSPGSSRRSHPMPDYSDPPSLAPSRKGSEFAKTDPEGFGHVPVGATLLSNEWQDASDADRGYQDSQFNEMMASFSPSRNDSVSGISAPSNTRVNSAANTPPDVHLRLSAAAISRAMSYEDHNRAVAMTTRDPPPPYTRAPSAVKPHSASGKSESRQSESPNQAKERAEGTIRRRPVGRPKGRKEGKTSEPTVEVASKIHRRTSMDSITAAEKENTESAGRNGDGKRKRISSAGKAKVALEDRVQSPDVVSPSRKASKTSLLDDYSPGLGDLDELTAEGVARREPLEELENYT